MATHLKRGWVETDEGTLGQSAERVLEGQLPHRDFDDYTGGLTFLHALAFKAFGINSASMRIVLFIFFVAWVPAVYYVASRFSSAHAAGAITLLAVAWSVPNYPGPMPSWYNLFFATAGAAALLRYIEKGTRWWLFLAGLCAGLSVLAKIAAAYFIAAALLFFVFREQSISDEQNREALGRARLYGTTVALGLAAFLFLLFSMIHEIPGTRGLFQFVSPAFGLVALLLSREMAGIAGSNRGRFVALAGMCAPFAAGTAIPLILFTVPYVITGSFRALTQGILAAPVRAIRIVSFPPSHPIAMLTVIPFLLPVLLASECRALGRAIWGGILAVFTGAVLFFSARSSFFYGLGWLSIRNMLPGLVLAGVAIVLVAGKKRNLSLAHQQRIMLLMSVAALCSLIQFPFAAPVYFFYVAPLAILLAMALFASAPNPPRLALATLIGFYFLFAVFRITPGFIYKVGAGYAPDVQTERLMVERAGGLRVEAGDAHLYDQLIPLVQEHAQGKFMYAAPDCPEVYFFSGLKSPSRHYFDFAEDPQGHTTLVLQELESLNVNVVAIKRNPRTSAPMAPELQSALELRYPHSEAVGLFQVRWK